MKIDYGNNYPSVTQVLDGLRKIGLENWFKYNTPDFIKAESEKAKNIGTLIHEVIQKHIELEKIQIETEYPAEVKNCIEGFFQFKKDHPEIKLKKAEIQITSEIHKFNGTLDCLAKEKGELILLDWKTGNAKEKSQPPIYPEHEYQVSAYLTAYNEMMKAELTKARILVFAKDKVAYSSIILLKDAMDEMFKDVFLSALKVWNYQNKGRIKTNDKRI